MREAVFAGSFYPKDKTALSSMIDNFFNKVDNKINKKDIKNNTIKSNSKNINDLISAIAPHAGYIYSGQTAAYTYKNIYDFLKYKPIDTFIIIGPNHTGIGRPISVSMDDWKTPLGIIRNDKEFSTTLVKSSKYIEEDETAHKEEHSIEVQLPFLQKIVNDPKSVFICMGDQSYESALILSQAIYDTAKILKRKIFLIASSDMNHYEPAEVAKNKDMKVLDKLKSLDIKGFYSALDETGDSMCGYGTAATAALFSKKENANIGILLNYTNSGEATHDFESVVSYASMGFYNIINSENK